MMNNGTTAEQAPVQAGEQKKKKITLATVKSFIRKNADSLWTKTQTSFDGMIDCVSKVDEEWKPANVNEILESKHRLWFVGGSRDYFQPYEKGAWKGFEVYNCCGSWLVATNIE
jgi:hypothetical protein